MTASPPPSEASAPESDYLVVGAADSVGGIPGSQGARFTYRFKQVEPSSDSFTFQDRDLSFYFRPTPTALFFQVENRQDRPVWIEWDQSTFFHSFSSRPIANAETRWSQRYGTLPPTQIGGLQRHSNYVFPIDLLADPGGTDDQLHRPLFPEGRTAPQYVDRDFGMDLVFRFDGRLQTYVFRFRVRSVIPR